MIPKIYTTSRSIRLKNNEEMKIESIGIIRGNPFKADTLTVNLGGQYFNISLKKLEDAIRVHKKFHRGGGRGKRGTSLKPQSIYRHKATIYRYR
jgi:hypothetical protein